MGDDPPFESFSGSQKEHLPGGSESQSVNLDSEQSQADKSMGPEEMMAFVQGKRWRYKRRISSLARQFIQEHEGGGVTELTKSMTISHNESKK